MDDEIRAYVKEEYTLQTTTTELTKKVNANGKEIEQIYGENTTEIPTLNLAQLSILADGINSEVSKKVGNDEIISKINQSAETVRILAKLIQFEGLVTANDNFKILEDGSIEAVNGSFKGNIYLPDGGEIIGGKGLLSNLQFVGVSKAGSRKCAGDFEFLGFEINPYYEEGQETKNSLTFDVYIPDGFTVLEARVFLFHAPVNFGYYDESGNEQYTWGYSRNLRLYKSNLTNFYRKAYIMSEFSDSDKTTETELTGFLGTNGYTAPTPSDSNHKVSSFTSGNFKSNLSTGLNRLVIKTANSVPASTSETLGNTVECAKQTGCVQAFINVIGYLNYKGE